MVGRPNYSVNDINFTHESYPLPTYTVSTTGRLLVAARVAVWNGTAYEVSAWDRVSPGYDTYGRYGIYSYQTCVLPREEGQEFARVSRVHAPSLSKYCVPALAWATLTGPPEPG